MPLQLADRVDDKWLDVRSWQATEGFPKGSVNIHIGDGLAPELGSPTHDQSFRMTPDQADMLAAKLVHSAAFARSSTGCGPRVTIGERGRRKLADHIYEVLASIPPFSH